MATQSNNPATFIFTMASVNVFTEIIINARRPWAFASDTDNTTAWCADIKSVEWK